MLFDIHTTRGAMNGPMAGELTYHGKFDYSCVASGFWGEHCIECGAPACYATCERYEQAPNSLCRLFRGGVHAVKLNKGRIAYGVHFKPWGKLELEFDGKMLSRRAELWIERLNRFFCGPIPMLGRKLINHYQSCLNRFVRRFLTHDGCPQKWIIECLTDEPTELLVSIFSKDIGEIFGQRLKIEKGFNTWAFDVPKITGVIYFRLSSLEGSKSPVFFTNLAVVSGMRDGQSKSACVVGDAKSSAAKYVKCVAWDLDNTLWRGILVEDGADRLVLRNEVVDVIKELDKRGIVSTLCSKNDMDPVRAVLKKMGLIDYFVFPRVNWMPKSENLRAIAKDMNIGIDSFAFVDDSIHERSEVSDHLPMVRIYDEKDPRSLLAMDCFNPPLSEESAKRRASYLSEMSRKDKELVFAGSHDDFLRSCDIKLTLVPVKDAVVRRRCWELVNRTNQLTLAARRYEEKEFDELVLSAESYAIKCRDKYGDYGIVGFVSVESGVFREFVMSCRVAKKKCEQSVVWGLAQKMASNGITECVAHVVETGRNVALIEAFDAMPFANKARSATGIDYNIRCVFNEVSMLHHPVEFKSE